MKSKQKSITSRIAAWIVVIGAVFIILLVAILYFFSYKVTKDMENKINNKLSETSSMQNYKISFSPFKCGGFMEYHCESKNIDLSSDDDKISFKDIKIITKDLNAKKRLEIILNSNIEYTSQRKDDELLEYIMPQKISGNLVFLNDKDQKQNDFLNVSLSVKTNSIFDEKDISLDSSITLKKSDDSVNSIVINLISNPVYNLPFTLNNAKLKFNFNKTITEIIDSLKSIDSNTKEEMRQTIIIVSNLFADSINAKLSPFFTDSENISKAIVLLSQDKLKQLDINLTSQSPRPIPLSEFVKSYLDNSLDLVLENIANDYDLKVILNGKN